jgi:hypothetical protein
MWFSIFGVGLTIPHHKITVHYVKYNGFGHWWIDENCEFDIVVV